MAILWGKEDRRNQRRGVVENRQHKGGSVDGDCVSHIGMMVSIKLAVIIW